MRSPVCWARVVFLGAISLAGVQANAQQANSPPVFSSEEDSVPNAVALPECARVWLARDAHVSSLLDRRHWSLAQLHSDWFAAGSVDLGKPDEKGLVIMGRAVRRGQFLWQLVPMSTMLVLPQTLDRQR